MTASRHTMFRPPAESDSVLIRVADGCPHNSCAFCAMYRNVPYREYDAQTLTRAIAAAAAARPDARRVFLADGDVLALPPETLAHILDQLRAVFPRLSRVNSYASGQSLTARSDEELTALRKSGMHTLYMGLESGSGEVLRLMAKGGTVRGMIDGCRRAQEAGLTMSIMALIGIGGQDLSKLHVEQTVAAINAMQPRLLSCLRLVPVPDTPLQRWIATGRFRQLTEEEAVRELRGILSGLELRHTVFRADHSSNILPLSGRLPRDKERLLSELDELLECGVLDQRTPGPMPAAL